MAVLNAAQLHYHPSNMFQIKNVCLEINEGETVSIIGPNGSGKSTVLRMLARLIKPDSGAIVLHGQELREMTDKDIARSLAMLPQINNSNLDLTVRDLVQYGRHPHQRWFAGQTAEDQRQVDWSIRATKLTKLADRPIYSLSGGERQRAWIAMALAQQPKLLLLDEPTTYLDISHQLELLELIDTLKKDMNMTVVMVLHDINQAAQYSDRLIIMQQGTIHSEGTPREVLTNHMFKSVFQLDVQIIQEEQYPYIRPLQCIR